MGSSRLLNPIWLNHAARELVILGIAAWVLVRQRRGLKSWGALLGLIAVRLKFGAKLPRCRTLLPRLPFVGNQMLIFEVLRRGAAPVLLEKMKENDWNLTELNGVMGVNFIVPTTREDLQYVLKTNWQNFAKNYDHDLGFEVNFEEVMGEGVFAVDGEKWRTHRKVASHLFSVTALKSKMEHVFYDHGTQLAGILKQLKGEHQTFDLQNLFGCLTFDTMCDIAFGVSPNALHAASHGNKPEFLESFDFTQTVSLLRMLCPPKAWKLMRWLGVGDEGKFPKHIEGMEQFLQGIVDKRRVEMSDGRGLDRGDLLSLYIQQGLREKDPSKKELMLSDKYLRDMIMNFMIAGRDTTSCLLTNMFKLLTEHPDAFDRLSAELNGLEGLGHDELATSTPYADSCINETLRMFPPVGGDGRYCLKDDVLPSGAQVSAGTMVGVANYALGRNPKLFENPDTYHPERWAEYDKIHMTHEYDLPVFWAGPRLCLGKDMARFEAKLIAACILRAGVRFEMVETAEAQAGKLAGEEFIQSPVMFYRHGLAARVL